MSLERQIATEKEFDKYVMDKINSSSSVYEAAPFLDDLKQKTALKMQGIKLDFYKEGEKVYYSFRTNSLE